MATRNVYSADVRVWATINVVADSPKEARRLIRERLGDVIEASESADFCGKSFDHPDLPKVSFSPAMTLAPYQRPDIWLSADEILVED